MFKQMTDVPLGYPLRKVALQNGAYVPNSHTAPILTGNPKPPWADDACIPYRKDGDYMQRITYSFDEKGTTLSESGLIFDEVENLFLNPRGRTGIIGRGILGKFGPNHAADVIATRYHPITGALEVLIVQRNIGDSTSVDAFPAGMVEAGQDVHETLIRELKEEAVNTESEASALAIDRLFSSECDRGIVYRGWVDDSRNTDNAWMETTAKHFHAHGEIAEQIVLGVTDTEEIKGVSWRDINSIDSMFASHKDWLDIVKGRFAIERLALLDKTMETADISDTRDDLKGTSADPSSGQIVADANGRKRDREE